MRKPYTTPQSDTHRVGTVHLVCGTTDVDSNEAKTTNSISSVGAAARGSSGWDDSDE